MSQHLRLSSRLSLGLVSSCGRLLRCLLALGAVLASGAYTSGAHAQAQAAPTLGPLDGEGRVTYFIAEGVEGSGFRAADRDLALWALQEWERSAGGMLKFEPGPEETALVRVRWVPAGAGQYGEMRRIIVNGRRGAEVFIRPDTEAFGGEIAQRAGVDALFRDTIVYLTCLHELGHALGLHHTADFRDVMFFFGFGGDIPRFFGRYRDQLQARDDIADVAGASAGDLEQLHELYPSSTSGALQVFRTAP